MAQQDNVHSLPYHFKQNNRVLIATAHGRHMQVTPYEPKFLNGDGNTDEFSVWKVHIENNSFIKLQSEKTGRYLRICDKGSTIDCDGGGGPFCLFKVNSVDSEINKVKLESDRFRGKYIAFKPNTEIKIGSGGRHCILTFWRMNNNNNAPKIQGQPHFSGHPSEPHHVPHPAPKFAQPASVSYKFDIPFDFKDRKRVVIGGPHGNHLRVSKIDGGTLDGLGKRGPLAQWEAIIYPSNLIQLKSCKTGKYLRIHNQGKYIDAFGVGGPFTYFKIHMFGKSNIVRLESNAFPNCYVAIPKDFNVIIGRGGPHCKLTFWATNNHPPKNDAPRQRPPRCGVDSSMKVNHNRNNSNGNNNNNNNNTNDNNGGGAFDSPYIFKMNNRVVIKSSHGKHLRISPQNAAMLDGVGGTGGLAQWDVILHAKNQLLQLRNAKSGKFLRIHDGGRHIDAQGIGGDLTFFKYHFCNNNHRNIVKLSSAKFPRAYVAIMQNHSVMVGLGGPHCELTFIRRGNIVNNVMNQLEGQLNDMRIDDVNIDNCGGTFGGPPPSMHHYNEHHHHGHHHGHGHSQPQQNKPVTCLLCNGKGHYGPFGFCDSGNVHKRGDCPLCKGKGWIVGNYTKCPKCTGKGGHGPFGPCFKFDVHCRRACEGCNGFAYIKM